MRRAWLMVRRAIPIYGGTARQYLAAALRLARAGLNADPLVQQCRVIIAASRAQRAASAPSAAALSRGFRAAASRHAARRGSYALHA
jgi:hypothetical protein